MNRDGVGCVWFNTGVSWLEWYCSLKLQTLCLSVAQNFACNAQHSSHLDWALAIDERRFNGEATASLAKATTWKVFTHIAFDHAVLPLMSKSRPMFSYLAVSTATSKLSFADCLPPETSCCLELLHASRAKGHGLEETVSGPETLHLLS
jgi:hypothetical protein